MLRWTNSLVAFCLVVACTSASVSQEQAVRPEGAGDGKPAAELFLMEGKASVTTATNLTFAAGRGLPLLRTDSVYVELGGYVVIKLGNGYLVRIAEDMAMPIADIALLDDPPTGMNVNEQMAAMLTKDELDRQERIAGWHAGPSAGQTVPFGATSENMEVKKCDETNKNFSGASEGQKEPSTPFNEKPATMIKVSTSVSAETSRPRPNENTKAYEELNGEKPPQSPPKIGDEKEPSKNEDGTVSQLPPNATVFATKDSGTKSKSGKKTVNQKVKLKALKWWIASSKIRTPMEQPAPNLLAKLASDPAFDNCLKKGLVQHYGRVPKALKSIKVMLRVKDRVVVELALGNGLYTPPCLAPLALGQAIPEVEQNVWVVFEVSIP